MAEAKSYGSEDEGAIKGWQAEIPLKALKDNPSLPLAASRETRQP